MLALREIRRGKGRFAAIVSALSLIVFLVLVLAALADGLFYGATGAVRTTTATAYMFSADAEGSLVRSRLDESQVAAAAAAPGVTAAGPVGVLLTGGTGPGGPLDAAVLGIEPGAPGTPTKIVEGRLPAPGEIGTGAADVRFRDSGIKLGDQITVGGVPATVVGFTGDSQYQLQPTLWTTVPTWRAMRDGARPELRGQPTAVNAIALTTAPNADLAAIAAAVPGTTVLSAEETGLAIPGVKQQSSTLNSIIYTTLAVAALVVGLFFALVVLEKRELFAALKALGASTGRLGSGVIVQAVGASIAGVVIGAVVSRLFGLIVPDQVPVLFRPESLLTVAIFTVVAGVVGAVFSLRRIAKIDPATAIGGAL